MFAVVSLSFLLLRLFLAHTVGSLSHRPGYFPHPWYPCFRVLSGCVRLLCRFLRLRVLLKAGGGGGGLLLFSICLLECMLSPFCTSRSLCFFLNFLLLPCRLVGLGLSSGSPLQPSNCLVHSRLFLRPLGFVLLSSVCGVPLPLPCGSPHSLLLHSALPTFSFVLLVLSFALLRFSRLCFHLFLCGWATPAAVTGFRFPLLFIL